MIMKQRMDSDSHIETAEGIELALPIANPVQRAFAFTIDFVIRLLIIWLASLALLFTGAGKTQTGILLVLLFVIWWGYYIICELLMNGQSPGKRAMSLQVVYEDFTPISFTGSLIRNLLRTADILPGFYGFGAVSVLFSNKNQRLGDLAAKTIVINTQKKYFRDLQIQAKALPPEMAFTEQEQRAIIEFARYYEAGATERAHEIAWHLRTTLNEDNIDQLVHKLRRYAKWFLGDRH